VFNDEPSRANFDLVIEGDGVRLALECDGDAWHGPEQYEQDVFRQCQLERAQALAFDEAFWGGIG
jgi:hypothetical protein